MASVNRTWAHCVFLMLPFTYMAKADNTPYYINRIPTCVHVIYICCDTTGVRQLPVDSETRYREWRARKEWFSHPLTPFPLSFTLSVFSQALSRDAWRSLSSCATFMNASTRELGHPLVHVHVAGITHDAIIHVCGWGSRATRTGF